MQKIWKILKPGIFLLLLCLEQAGYGQSAVKMDQDFMQQWDGQFTEIEAAGLHIHIGKFYDLKNRPEITPSSIPSQLLSQTGSEFDKGQGFAVNSFWLDAKKQFKGYLIAGFDPAQNFRIILKVIHKNGKQVPGVLEVAAYGYLESAYERILNSMLTDLNDDGYLDIVVVDQLTDFELPNEYADNISNTKRFIYLFDPGSGTFQYELWPADLKLEMKLKP
ncbi:MAG: hypothetical protein H6581_29610 [Bacteroidia bacterium]|nr:hypothetical protein [Bacteroidia bacterium]